MKKAVFVQTMRQGDENTIKGGVSSKELMLRAGKAIAESHDFSGKTAIVCGKGNNAGDGYVLATILQDKAQEVALFLVENSFSEDGKYYFDQCVNKNIPYEMLSEKTDLSGFDTVVDCLFGTGFRGEPTGCYRIAIEKINASDAFVLSADIASGINGDNGLGDCFVRSILTVTIGEYKPGLFLARGKDAAKKIIVADIGIKTENNNMFVSEDTDYKEFIQKREEYSHKGKFGYTAILGGCENYVGAVKLAASSLSALRAGGGVTRLIVGKNVYPYVAPIGVESTFFTLPTDEDGDMIFDEDKLSESIKGTKAVAVGMGWGKGKDNRKIVRYLVENYEGRLLIDADGLNALAYDTDVLLHKKGEIVLTPHLGEMSRLMCKTIAEIESDPIGAAKSFSSRYGVVTVLKGPTTIVTDGEETILVPKGCVGMATAGSGDVLSGILVGILGQDFDNILLSVAYATYLNGLSGEIAQQEKGDISLIASDTVAKIPEAIRCLRAKNEIKW